MIPSRQEIIDAIKRKNNKAREHVKQKKPDNGGSTRIVPVKTTQHPTLENIETKMTNLIDNRSRYWIENRISQLLSSDNFTTREGYSFSIDTDRSKAGLCFRFTKNGTTIARIDSDGNLYCSNVFINSTNLNSVLKMTEGISSNSVIYVKHTDLKNGSYDMNINKITAGTGNFSNIEASGLIKTNRLQATYLIQAPFIQAIYQLICNGGVSTQDLSVEYNATIKDLYVKNNINCGEDSETAAKFQLVYIYPTVDNDNENSWYMSWSGHGILSKYFYDYIQQLAPVVHTMEKNKIFYTLKSENTLGNNDYFKVQFTDGVGGGFIQMFHDTQYYGLELKIETDNNDDNKLCIYPTGVTVDGELTCYDDVSIWENLEVGKLIETSHNTAATAIGTNLTAAINELISAYSPDLSNYAQLNAENYFTVQQHITTEYNHSLYLTCNRTGVDWYTFIDAFAGNMAGNGSVANLLFGRENSAGNCGYIGFRYYGSNSANNCLTFGFHSYDHLMTLKRNKTLTLASGSTFEAPTIKLNGTSLATTLNNCAKLTANNTFTVDQRIVNTSGNPGLMIGRGLSTNNAAVIHWRNDLSQLGLGFWNNDDIIRINTTRNVTIDGNLESVYNTAASAIGPNLTAAINELISSAGGFTALDNTGYIWSPAYMPMSTVSVCYGNGTYVAVGTGFYCSYSFDSINWFGTLIADNSTEFRGVAYGNGVFVAVAWNKRYGAYSSDGITWHTCDLLTSRMWTSVCFANNKFVAVAYESRYGAYSSDGITWNQCDLGTSSRWYSITYGLDIYLAISEYSIYTYSSDGVNWTYRSLPTGLRQIAFGNGKFVGVKFDTLTAGTNIVYSSDGLAWTEAHIDGINWISIAYGNGIFIVGNYEGLTPLYSSDGATWTKFDTYGMLSNARVCFCNDRFICVGGGRTAMILSPKLLSPTYPVAHQNTLVISNMCNQFYDTSSVVDHNIGRTTNNGYCAKIRYYHGSVSNRYAQMGLSDSSYFRFSVGQIAPNSPIVSSSTITATSFITSSDRRIKENIEEIPEADSVKLIDNIKTYSFYLKNIEIKNEEEEEAAPEPAAYPKRLHYGIIAQELQQLDPALVSTNDVTSDHYLAINYIELIPHLINKIHAQDRLINELSEKINKLLK